MPAYPCPQCEGKGTVILLTVLTNPKGETGDVNHIKMACPKCGGKGWI